ncbi:MAG: recombinase family protein [Oscillospiraceae bacterium]|nr:recombinase family protein [Oscillospiraceae bacterium]
MKAVIYARYSSDTQTENSIEGQLRECKEFAKKNGFKIFTTYIDRAFSAKTDNRPQFKKMIKDSSKKLFDVIIVWKLDRFARNRYDSAHYKALLRKNGVKVVSATEPISEDSTGILLESLLEGYAEFFSAELSEKVKRGMTENALKCKWNGGGMPIGYTVDEDRHFKIDESTAPYVLESFKRYDNGEKIIDIVRWLNDCGVQTYRLKPVSFNSVGRMLKNRSYIGEYRYATTVIPEGVPEIVPVDLFDRVQARLAKNKKAPSRHKAEDDYILTTKLFCGLCSAFMFGESGTGSANKVYHYYKCATAKKFRACKKKTVKKVWMEDIIINLTLQFLANDDILDVTAESILELQRQENITLPMLQKQLAETERSIEHMLNAIQQGILTSSTKKRLDELEATKGDIEVKILQEEIEEPLLTKEQILFWFHQFRGIDVSVKENRQWLIDTFVNAIYLYDDRLVITFNNKEGAKTITLAEIESTFSSDISSSAVPNA